MGRLAVAGVGGLFAPVAGLVEVLRVQGWRPAAELPRDRVSQPDRIWRAAQRDKGTRFHGSATACRSSVSVMITSMSITV
jgi:hypothetical protein